MIKNTGKLLELSLYSGILGLSSASGLKNLLLTVQTEMNLKSLEINNTLNKISLDTYETTKTSFENAISNYEQASIYAIIAAGISLGVLIKTSIDYNKK